ncbi:hypothetical protein PAHAL_2G316900 [Panicum hallii]|uniref:Pectinesterase inhibitor domain-containing protein n=1 Tax=Panicum hallii TaxID=206008 RepID=A0A2T8KR78_9POAL|nr:hypothetical protein PAHAL_2G316900 [Panicum hallii]
MIAGILEFRMDEEIPGGGTCGRFATRRWGSCATFADASLGREGDLMAMLGRLETAAGRGRGEQAEWDLQDANLYTGSVASSATSCVDDLASISDAGRKALAPPVGGGLGGKRSSSRGHCTRPCFFHEALNVLQSEYMCPLNNLVSP